MREMISSFIFSLLFSGQFVSGQITTDSLIGKWELTKIICYSDGNTTRQEPSAAPRGMTTSMPPTTLTFDSLQQFIISQHCMKCPFLEWTGQYQLEIMSIDGHDQYYLRFIEHRDKYLKKKEKSLTAEFNGRLTKFENNAFQLSDDKRCNLLYQRIKN